MIVRVNGQDKGTLDKDRSRYVWWNRDRGTEIFSKLSDKESVRRFIARVSLVEPETVTFHREPKN